MKKDKGIRKPDTFLLLLSVIYPAGIIAFEMVDGFCKDYFFDPMPTIGHKIILCLGPVFNYILWHHYRYNADKKYSRSWFWMLEVSNASAIAIAAFYTIIFLPVTPMAIIAVIYFGIGFLGLAPLIALCATIYIRLKFHKKYIIANNAKFYLIRVMIAVFLLMTIFDFPQLATKIGSNLAVSHNQETRNKGLKIIRYFGDQELLLRSCYERTGKFMGPIGYSILYLYNGYHDFDRNEISTSQAREVFYQVTGETFNKYPVPYSSDKWSIINDFQFDADMGGADVAGRVRGLHLASSIMNGSIDADSGVAYLEWTLEFKNSSRIDRETRLQALLPPQAVVSRATLWVNGQEKEAAFASRSQVRQAYESIVKVTRRDPFLVTTQGVDRVLMQAFPVPANGNIKFRVGITAPLELVSQDKAQLVLPAIVDRNFNIANDVTHQIWIEGKSPILADIEQAKITHVKSDLYRINLDLNDRELARNRQIISAKRNPAMTQLWSQFNDNPVIVQNIVKQDTKPAKVVGIVIDGSVNMKDYVGDIVAAIDDIAQDKLVGLYIASQEPYFISPVIFSPANRELLIEHILNTKFVGGQDNGPALVQAFQDLEAFDDAHLIWIHNPQPMTFSASKAFLENALSRLVQLPKIKTYSILPGPNKLLDDAKWALNATALPKTNNVTRDLSDYFAAILTSKSQIKIQRTASSNIHGYARGSHHISRLWARDQIYSLIAQNKNEDAVKLAAHYQLVTPVSGAVVLETQQQYDANGLQPVDANSVPTIPEPHEWLLLMIITLLMIWFLKQNRHLLLRKL